MNQPQVCPKRRYPTRKIAETYRRRAQAREGGEGTFRVYPCPRCGGFHLTSQDQKKPGPKVRR